MRATRSVSQEAARAVGEGTFADGSRSSHSSPRTPAGPSESTSRRRPMAGSAGSAQKSSPVSRRTFCSRLSFDNRSSLMGSFYSTSRPSAAIAATIAGSSVHTSSSGRGSWKTMSVKPSAW